MERFPAAALTAAQTARLDAAKARTAWVGQLHGEVVREGWANRQAFARMSRSDKCGFLIRVVLDRSPRVRELTDYRFSEELTARVIEATKQNAKFCGSPGQLNSLLGPKALHTGRLAAQGTEGDTLTQAGLDLVASLQTAVGATDGSPGQVQAVTDAVLSQHTDIPTPDLEYGAAAAGLAVNSATEFYAIGNSGGFPSEPPPEAEYSIFRATQGEPWWYGWGGRVVGADLVGCALGGAVGMLLGGPGGALAGCMTVGGLVSLGVILGLY